MGLQGPPYAVLSPMVTDPLAPPGDPESSLFLTCHFVLKGLGEYKIAEMGKTHGAYMGPAEPAITYLPKAITLPISQLKPKL